jgi:hypothetical protein
VDDRHRPDNQEENIRRGRSRRHLQPKLEEPLTARIFTDKKRKAAASEIGLVAYRQTATRALLFF